MSILIPLNSQNHGESGDSSGTGFQGGGTAFWTPSDWKTTKKLYAEDETHDRASTATFSLSPLQGTALLFVGSVTHSGLAVTAGERCILVTSFSSAPDPNSNFKSEAQGVGGTWGSTSTAR